MTEAIRPVAKVAATVAGYYYGGPAGAVAASAAFESAIPEDKPEAPKQGAAPTMPTPDDAAIRAARKRRIAAQSMRRGRASTILTGPTERLGD